MIHYVENPRNNNYFKPGESVRCMIEGPTFPNGGEKWGVITWEGFCKSQEIAQTHCFYSHAENGYVWSDMVTMDAISREELRAEVDLILQRSNHGGKRPNAGRKQLYGPTKRIVRLIPIAWLQEFEDWLEAKKRLANPTDKA